MSSTFEFPMHSAWWSRADRLDSFMWWNGEVMNYSRMATSGLFCTDQRIRCFWCDTVFRDLTVGDDCVAKHLELCPDCPFAHYYVDTVAFCDRHIAGDAVRLKHTILVEILDKLASYGRDRARDLQETLEDEILSTDSLDSSSE